MGLFSKTEVIEARLPFTIQPLPAACDKVHEEGERGGMIDFEAYGRIGDDLVPRYFYAIVGCSHLVYSEFLDTLVNISGTPLKITAKVKNGKVKSFKIDFKDVAEKVHQQDYEKLFVTASRVSDKTSLF